MWNRPDKHATKYLQQVVFWNPKPKGPNCTCTFGRPTARPSAQYLGVKSMTMRLRLVLSTASLRWVTILNLLHGEYIISWYANAQRAGGYNCLWKMQQLIFTLTRLVNRNRIKNRCAELHRQKPPTNCRFHDCIRLVACLCACYDMGDCFY